MNTKRANWLVAALVVTHVALHAVALSMLLDWMPAHLTLWPPDFLMLGPSQGTLVAFWAVLGGGKVVWRVLAVILGSLLYLACLSKADKEWLTITFVQMSVCAVLLLLFRWAGLRLLRYSDPKMASGPFQFYIRDLFAWTTALAVVLSAWRCLPAGAFAFLNRSIPAAVVVSLTLVSGISIFSALGRHWVVARTLLLPIVVIPAAMLSNATINDTLPWWHFPSLLGIMAAWITGSLLVLRFAGYRLAWRPRPEPPQANGNDDAPTHNFV